MDDMDPWLVEVFFDVQRGLPRQGVGNDESTSNALALCSELPDNPAVLDIGCGPGMQTMFLAESTSGSVVAVDTCDEYLDELRQKLEQASLPDRVQVKHADMTALDFPGNTFDVIWCEGAIYNMGVAEALKTWRPLLRDKGYLVFSELVWLDDEPAVEVADFFRDGYPAMTSIEANIKMIRESGYEPVDDFTLADSAWWDEYYTPLEAKFPSLRQKYRSDKEALGIIAKCETEVDIRRRFADSYGYHFFVTRANTSQ